MKKLIVVLVVLALSMPSMAAYIGFDREGNSDGCINPLHVDVDGQNTINTATCNLYQHWVFQQDWTGPITQAFVNPYSDAAWEIPTVSAEVFKTNIVPSNAGGSRSRNGGIIFVAGTGEYNATAKMLGMNYLKLTVTNLQPGTEYKVRLWSYENRPVWSANSNNPDSKYGVWSTTDPVAWLTANGYPNGYAPTEQTNGSSGMPAGLKALVAADGGRCFMMATDANDHLGSDLYCVNTYVMSSPATDDEQGGVITLYGWIDMTDWAGSAHMPLEGFTIVPEPMTIALLGLGGLALLRRKNA